MVLSRNVLTKFANATKMNSECIYIGIATYCSYVLNELLIVICWTLQELTRKTANTHDFVI